MVSNKEITEMIGAFMRLPGAGPKSAPRMVYYLLNRPDEEVFQFADMIKETKKKIKYCKKCCTITDRELCPICADEKRDFSVIMVVETPRNIETFEQTGKYRGTYHVLNGLLSPTRGILEDEIRLKELIHRLMAEPVEEVIISLNYNPDSEYTADYIAKLIKPAGIKVTRILSGIPTGADLENVDEITLGNALINRKEYCL